MPPAAKPSGVVVIATANVYDRGSRIGELTKIVPPDLANGLAPGDPATVELLNYLHNEAGRWLEYLRDFEDRAHNWGETTNGLQAFYGQTVFGNGLLLANDAQLPRFAFRRPQGSVVGRVFLGFLSEISAFPLPGSFSQARLYAHANAGSNAQYLEIAINAKWDPTAAAGAGRWTKDINGQFALLFRLDTLSTSSAYVLRKAFDQNAEWSDTLNDDNGWTRTVMQFGDAERKLVSGWALDATDTNWQLQSLGQPRQIAVAGAGLIYLPLDGILPPWPVRVKQIRVRISPTNTHVGLPAIMPKFNVRKDEGSSVGFGDIVDPSATFGAYNAAHTIDTDAGGSGFVPFVTDPLSNYYLQFAGEAGANSVANLRVNYVQVNYE